MSALRSWLSTLVVLFLLLTVAAVPRQVGAVERRLKAFDIEDGLRRARIYHLLEDSRGFLWIATPGGVIRYDGTTFVTFDRRDGLSHNVVKNILEDHQHHLWFGTYGGGVCRYDYRQFRCYGTAAGLPGGIVERLSEDTTGRIWVATTVGIAYLDGDRFQPLEFPELVGAAFYTMHVDRTGRLLLATDRGLFEVDTTAIASGPIRVTRPILSAPAASEGVDWIFEDHDGAIWLGSRSSGQVIGLETPPPIGFALHERKIPIRTAFRDRAGTLWLGTEQLGLIEVVGESWTKHDLGDDNVESVNVVIEDRRGNIWVGTEGGLAVFEETAFRLYGTKQGLEAAMVWAITEDTTNNIWLGTDAGLCRIDGATARCGLRPEHAIGNVRALLTARDGRVWVGARGSLLQALSGVDLALCEPLSERRLSSVFSLLQDGTGRVWAGTNRHGAWVGDGQSWVAGVADDEHWSGRVFAMLEGPDGTMWLGSYGDGLGRAAPGAEVAWYNESDGLCGNVIMSLAQDRRGTLWIGTLGRGVCSFDGKRFRSYSERDGLASSTVYLLLVDAHDTLWVGSDKGIDRLDLGAQEQDGPPPLRHFEVPAGAEYNHAAAFEDSRGFLWFGTSRGALRFDPRAERADAGPIVPTITDVRLYHESTHWDREMPGVDLRYGLPPQIDLAHDRNHLSFEYSGTELASTARLRYRFRLDGSGETWSPATTERHATYSFVPPGTYTFLVEASRDGVDWSGEPARMSVRIRPPWWSTWWFRSATIVLLTLAVVSGYSLRIRQIEARQAQRSEWNRRVNEARLTALRAQMNPHFIFNALNSIQQLIPPDVGADAQRYLGKFAKLLRSILRSSERSFIPLADELQQIALYLDMESLRFAPAGFHHQLRLDPQLDVQHLEIPPMLIQPVIENAIRHGLRHRSYRGSILIELSPLGADEILCVIEDDGVGRAEAERIESAANPTHEPVAMQALAERLMMIDVHTADERERPARVQVDDLFDQDGIASGTRVSLRIPTRQVAACEPHPR